MPYRSLQAGQWVKLICGASYQDMPTIRRLAMVYALAGVDCVDVAADVAVVAAARQGFADAVTVAQNLDRLTPGLSSNDPTRQPPAVAPVPLVQHVLGEEPPWLMVSLNDSEDPHFRKAFFEVAHCPPDCPRPCEGICPTAAIDFSGQAMGGVIPNLCYGCGRCMAVCPVDNIVAQSHLARPEDFPPESLSQVDAVEIHTHVGRQREFAALWERLEPWRGHIKLVSVSCPDAPHMVEYLQTLHHLMAPLSLPLIWQTDGRPMSGDLGKGTTHATLRLAQTVLAAGLPGYVQLAGGTNGHTVQKLRTLGLLKAPNGWDGNVQLDQSAQPPAPSQRPWISGIAYGSYARTVMMPLLDALEPYLVPWLTPWPQDTPQGIDGLSPPMEDSGPTASTKAIAGLEALSAAIHRARQVVGTMKPGYPTSP